jgi:hypothetical protein
LLSTSHKDITKETGWRVSPILCGRKGYKKSYRKKDPADSFRKTIQHFFDLLTIFQSTIQPLEDAHASGGAKRSHREHQIIVDFSKAGTCGVQFMKYFPERQDQRRRIRIQIRLWTNELFTLEASHVTGQILCHAGAIPSL